MTGAVCRSESDLVLCRELVRVSPSSLGSFVLAGLSEGDVDDDALLGPVRGCWCISLHDALMVTGTVSTPGRQILRVREK